MRIAIYAPVYNNSPGTRFRVDALQKALHPFFDTFLIVDQRQYILKKLYHTQFRSLSLRFTVMQKILGKIIYNSIKTVKPNVVILVHFESALAIPFLHEAGITSILFTEDLSKNMLIGKPDPWEQTLIHQARKAAFVVALSTRAKKILNSYGLHDVLVIPPGVDKVHISQSEAIQRINKGISILHSGAIENSMQYLILDKILNYLKNDYKVYFAKIGRYCPQLMKKHPNITWYWFSSFNEALQKLRECSIGLIVRHGVFMPSRLFFHASLLQPIVGIGDYWISEIEDNKIGLICKSINSITNAIDTIVTNYDKYVNNMYKYAEKNNLQKVYFPLINRIINNVR